MKIRRRRPRHSTARARDEIAAMVAFVTGMNLTVDGGMNA
jgi:hypothetical protein